MTPFYPLTKDSGIECLKDSRNAESTGGTRGRVPGGRTGYSGRDQHDQAGKEVANPRVRPPQMGGLPPQSALIYR